MLCKKIEKNIPHCTAYSHTATEANHQCELPLLLVAVPVQLPGADREGLVLLEQQGGLPVKGPLERVGPAVHRLLVQLGKLHCRPGQVEKVEFYIVDVPHTGCGHIIQLRQCCYNVCFQDIVGGAGMLLWLLKKNCKNKKHI